MINLTRKFSILSPKISRHRIELRQDRYLSMRKLSNRAARARDLARSKTPWSLLKSLDRRARSWSPGPSWIRKESTKLPWVWRGWGRRGFESTVDPPPIRPPRWVHFITMTTFLCPERIERPVISVLILLQPRSDSTARQKDQFSMADCGYKGSTVLVQVLCFREISQYNTMQYNTFINSSK